METMNPLSQFFMWFGHYKWPMIIISAIVAVLIIKKAIDMLIPGKSAEARKAGISAILFWGSFSLIFGLFVQTVSLWAALQEIIQADDISPVIVMIGFYGSFCPTIFGAGTLLTAASAWMLFRWLGSRAS